MVEFQPKVLQRMFSCSHESGYATFVLIGNSLCPFFLLCSVNGWILSKFLPNIKVRTFFPVYSTFLSFPGFSAFSALCIWKCQVLSDVREPCFWSFHRASASAWSSKGALSRDRTPEWQLWSSVITLSIIHSTPTFEIPWKLIWEPENVYFAKGKTSSKHQFRFLVEFPGCKRFLQSELKDAGNHFVDVCNMLGIVESNERNKLLGDSETQDFAQTSHQRNDSWARWTPTQGPKD